MFVRNVKESRAQSSSTLVETFWNPIGTWNGFLFVAKSSSKSFLSRFKSRTPIFTQSPARLVFIFRRVAIFFSDCVKTEHRLLGASGAKSLRPREVYFSFSVSSSFSCEARNNLGQPMKIDALEGALVKAFSDRVPRFTAVHQRTQVSVSVRS